MVYKDSAEIMRRAYANGLVVPAFNIPYLPMMRPVVEALRDTGTFGMIAVARLEWVKFESRSLDAVREEYERCRDDGFTRLHLDHVPVVDEDGLEVPFVDEISHALDLGFESVMVDGSRLSLGDNIAATRDIVALAHGRQIPVEGELGAVLGHSEEPLPPYDELFESGQGFTDVGEAKQFVGRTGVDWLSIACGNIHGAISGASKDQEKVKARLSQPLISKIASTVRQPLVLHGGTGISPDDVRSGIRKGIAKINIASAIRQPYERTRSEGAQAAHQSVYRAVRRIVDEELKISGSADALLA